MKSEKLEVRSGYMIRASLKDLREAIYEVL